MQELPESLDEIYQRALRGIEEAKQEYAHRLFQCLVASFRPLRVEELADVLATGEEGSEYDIGLRPEDAQQALLSTCSSLITVVDVDGSPVVQFSHFSVKEFLMSSRLANARQELSRYHVSPDSGHAILSRASLSVLLSLDHQVDENTIENYPLAIYAAQHWVSHAKFGNISSSTQSLMERLFDREKPQFATWIWMHDPDSLSQKPMTAHPTQPEASPLYYAALCGFPHIVEHLTKTFPVGVNANGGYHVTPLHAALVKREFDIVRVLLRHGADINSPGRNGLRPLHSASSRGDHDAVQLLLERQADVNIQVDESPLTPLHFSALAGHVQVCQLLLEKLRLEDGFDSQDEHTGMSLLAASIGGHPAIVQFLLDNGTSLAFRDDEGQTPLAVASRYGHVEVVRILLDRGADVASRDDDQSTPLNHASKHGHLDVVHELLAHGADPNAQGEDFQTPLHLAAGAGYLGIVQLLLKRGSALDKMNRSQETPLHLALCHGKLEVARFLIDHRANLVSKGSHAQAATHLPSSLQVLDLMELSLEGDLGIERRRASEKTPLHSASGDGKLKVTGELLVNSFSV